MAAAPCKLLYNTTQMTFSLPVQCKVHAGVQEALSRLHRWPEGIEDSRTWVTNTFHVICSITAQHASDARDQGIPPEEHLRSVIADPG